MDYRDGGRSSLCEGYLCVRVFVAGGEALDMGL